MTDVLEQWRKAIGDSEAECYWPGPRPIDEDDRLDQLHGRDQVVKDFARDVREHRVVVFSGASGVGKSSVLNRGIRPYLRNQGFTVMACNRWGDAGGDVDDIDAFMRTKLIGVPKGLDSERPLVDQLHERFGSRAVIVLDQFEELIRHEPKISRAVTDWIEDAVLDTDIRIVVSLREEYTPRLRGLRVGPWQRRDFSLEPISDIETIGEIVREGHRTDAAAGVPDVVIEEPAVQQLQRLWAAAEGGTDASDIGLLHLQAMLYILWRRTRLGSPDGIIRAEDLSRFVTARDEDSDAGQGADAARRVFRRALAGVVSLRLELCEDVYLRHPLGDRTVATGVRTMIRRSVAI